MSDLIDLRQGDVLDRLREIPEGSVHCVVTSPPYWGLRDYGLPPSTWGDGWEGCLGLEPTPQRFVAHLVEVFAEVKRVLRADGVAWMNMGDCYAHNNTKLRDEVEQEREQERDEGKGYTAAWQTGTRAGFRGRAASACSGYGLAPKQRLLMPARCALALQADGWWVRSEIVWAKGLSFCPTYAGSVMPSSARDRPTDAHEMVYLLTKSARYFYDADAVREASQGTTPRPASSRNHEGTKSSRTGNHANGGNLGLNHPSSGRNLRTVWAINPQPYREAHFATYPEKLVRPCVLAGTSERGACAECGAPWWRRVVERVPMVVTPSPGREAAAAAGEKGGTRGTMVQAPSSRTLGWQPTCECCECGPDPLACEVAEGCCPAPVVPCTVLDPFSGSGTTGLVASRLGRRYVGIELNAGYLALSEKRLGQRDLLADLRTEAEAPGSTLPLFGAPPTTKTLAEVLGEGTDDDSTEEDW